MASLVSVVFVVATAVATALVAIAAVDTARFTPLVREVNPNVATPPVARTELTAEVAKPLLDAIWR
jgi:hypothetical protein|tara:strand:+ start:26474 stop:26671 length:198 start_codon:yes stop_codon:yes gene_type:complete